MALSAREERYWRRYLQTLAATELPQAPVVTAEHAGSPEMSDRLLRLYLEGTKSAGSGLVEDYVAAHDPLPQVGDYWIAMAGDGGPRCILRTVGVEVHRFSEIPERIAIAEGEGDLSVAHWQRAHAELYAPHLDAWGVRDIEEANVVTEFFQVVYRHQPAD